MVPHKRGLDPQIQATQRRRWRPCQGRYTGQASCRRSRPPPRPSSPASSVGSSSAGGVRRRYPEPALPRAPPRPRVAGWPRRREPAAGSWTGAALTGAASGSGMRRLPAIQPRRVSALHLVPDHAVVGGRALQHRQLLAEINRGDHVELEPGPTRRLVPSALVMTCIPGYHCAGGGSGSSRPLMTRRASVRTFSSWK